MKISFTQTKVLALAALATIGSVAMQPNANANIINPKLVLTPAQSGQIKLFPMWTISGEVQISAGKYASLQGVTCDQFTIRLNSQETVQAGYPFQNTVPKYSYPANPVKMKKVSDVPGSSTQPLKCKYSISGTQYSGDLVKFNVNGPFSDVSYPDNIYIVPGLNQQSTINFSIWGSNIG